MKPSLKLTLVLVAQFALGGVCGVVLATRPWFVASMQKRWEARWIKARADEDAQRLKLTAEQRARVSPTYTQMLADVRQARAATTHALVEAATNQGRALWPELTPEQQQEFSKMSAERGAAARKTTTP